FLDLFRPESQRRLIAKLTGLCAAGACWVNVDYRPTDRPLWFVGLDWCQYRIDRLFSGVEAGRHYDPSRIFAQSGWSVREDRRFCGGAAAGQLLLREAR